MKVVLLLSCLFVLTLCDPTFYITTSGRNSIELTQSVAIIDLASNSATAFTSVYDTPDDTQFQFPFYYGFVDQSGNYYLGGGAELTLPFSLYSVTPSLDVNEVVSKWVDYPPYGVWVINSTCFYIAGAYLNYIGYSPTALRAFNPQTKITTLITPYGSKWFSYGVIDYDPINEIIYGVSDITTEVLVWDFNANISHTYPLEYPLNSYEWHSMVYAQQNGLLYLLGQQLTKLNNTFGLFKIDPTSGVGNQVIDWFPTAYTFGNLVMDQDEQIIYFLIQNYTENANPCFMAIFDVVTEKFTTSEPIKGLDESYYGYFSMAQL